MIVLIIVVSAIVGLFFLSDYIIFNRKLDNFEVRARDLVDMFNYCSKRVNDGNPEDVEITEFSYEGTVYRAVVEKGDYSSLYLQMTFAIADVLHAYEEIGERYLEQMDPETAENVERLHQKVENIESTVKYQSWLHGVV